VQLIPPAAVTEPPLLGGTTVSLYVDCPPPLVPLDEELEELEDPPPQPLPPAPGALKHAFTVMSAFSVTAQLGAEPQPPTLQPLNGVPSDHAFRTTVVPAG
jgi:hypothetical protein